MPGYIKLNGETYGTSKVVVQDDNEGVILWENPDLTANFPAQTIELKDDIEKYQYVEICFSMSAGGDTYFSTGLLPISQLLNNGKVSLRVPGVSVLHERFISFMQGSADVSVCNAYKGNPPTVETELIPVQIAAYKYTPKMGANEKISASDIFFDNAGTMTDSNDVQGAVKDAYNRIYKLSKSGTVVITKGPITKHYVIPLTFPALAAGDYAHCTIMVTTDKVNDAYGILELSAKINNEGIPEPESCFARWIVSDKITPSYFTLDLRSTAGNGVTYWVGRLWQYFDEADRKWDYKVISENNTIQDYNNSGWNFWEYYDTDGRYIEIIGDGAKFVSTITDSLHKLLGTTDISAIGGGTVTGAINALKTGTKSLTSFNTIPSGADLKGNAYIIPGNYCCTTNVGAESLLNCPVAEAFTMTVSYAAGSTAYIKQTIETFTGNKIVARMFSALSGSWISEYTYAPEGVIDGKKVSIIAGEFVIDNAVANTVYRIGDFEINYKRVISICTTGIGGISTWDLTGGLVVDSYTARLNYICRITQANVQIRYRILYSDTDLY